VSAFEPQLPTDPKVDMPDFMVVLRGFDRRQVEMWAAEVAQQIEQERQRADEAEKRAYRVQIENKGAPSFSHLGTHVASILEEAGKSSENMLADAADRAQETIEAAEEEAAQIIKAAEHRAGEIEADAREIVKAAEHRAGEIEADAREIVKAAEHRAGEIEGDATRTLEEARSEGARVEEDALQAAEEMRAQAEQDARTVLEEARDATDMIWQEAERERLGVEAETIRLETLRHRSLEQLGRVYGHLESVLDEVRAGIGRVEEEQEDLDEATAAAAARLGVEPPASSPEESPRFPDLRDAQPRDGDGEGEDGDLGLGDGDDGMLAATRPDTPPTPDTAPEEAEATQPVPAAETDETTQPSLPDTTAETTQPDPAIAAADGEGPADDQDATQRLEPVGNVGNNKPRSAKPAGSDDKGQP
jgi:cell division septum initiation protein DivIVA